MKIDCLVLGDYQTNCYVLRAADDAVDCIVIDPGMQPEPLLDFLSAHRLNPLAAVLTHGHADHIVGVAALREAFSAIKVFIHELDAEMLQDPARNLSAFAGVAFTAAAADVLVRDGSVIEVAGIKLQVLHTPGHTPGGICLYARDHNLVFTDDALFAESIGRTDFPGSSSAQLITAIREKLLTLPDDTVVYPGHGPATTIAREKTTNPFL